jgi:hypothetical protein
VVALVIELNCELMTSGFKWVACDMKKVADLKNKQREFVACLI